MIQLEEWKNTEDLERDICLFDSFWPELKEQAVSSLASSLCTNPPFRILPVLSGTLELRATSIDDARKLFMRDREFYETALSQDSEDSFCAIASYVSSPLIPVGLFHNVKYQIIELPRNRKRTVGEPRLVYVSPEYRGRNISNALVFQSMLCLCYDEQVQTIRIEAASNRIASVISSMGFYEYNDRITRHKNFCKDLRNRKNMIRKLNSMLASC